MNCAESLGPGLAALSAAIEAGEIFANETFAAHCTECSGSEPSVKAREAFVKKIDNKAICQVMCCCKDESYRQVCVQKTLASVGCVPRTINYLFKIKWCRFKTVRRTHPTLVPKIIFSNK
ncbi:hypothetical protein PN36_27625 [Candidatus Thiomargarita nelsonii]|uniref:Uncharacterized protein n=1 Tax=Candidatus Thiomargarita nelsonii TaxID=1003181 RepID=A0A0A6PCT3_9GAMM|nr:hypothetical protein PN36_27625 [Candidatus Thiomargarita nelsonii]